MIWRCSVCGWKYDEEKGVPEMGIEPGTAWDDVPEDFKCPKCGAQKKWFKPFEE
jgi:rubredoxin